MHSCFLVLHWQDSCSRYDRLQTPSATWSDWCFCVCGKCLNPTSREWQMFFVLTASVWYLWTTRIRKAFRRVVNFQAVCPRGPSSTTSSSSWLQPASSSLSSRLSSPSSALNWFRGGIQPLPPLFSIRFSPMSPCPNRFSISYGLQLWLGISRLPSPQVC